MAKTIRHEFDLIERKKIAPYFLTVHDIVTQAREMGILCQGRGSAANSAVCYCLGITAVDPDKTDVLFERFISNERNEPPDIDVDFEHERREEVIQYIYGKYGRDARRARRRGDQLPQPQRHARRRQGARPVARHAGRRWPTRCGAWVDGGVDAEHVREAGLDPDAIRGWRLALELSATLIGFPRHLSQHVGGFVLTAGRLDELVPIENAAMDDRTVIQWDKDDLDALGISRSTCWRSAC